MQWTQYIVCSGHSRIVVYGGGDIVFGAKRSNQWMQWMQYTVDAVNSGCSTQWMQWNNGTLSLVQKGKTSECSGFCIYCVLHPLHTVSTVYRIYCILCPLHTVSTAYCVHCIHWFDLFCTKDNVPTIIYHYSTVSTVSTVYCIHCVLCPLLIHCLIFLHQRQCPHHYMPLFHFIHCVHCILHPLVWPFCNKDNVPTTIIPPFHCIHCIYCIHCILFPLHTESTGLTFLHQRQCPHHHIPLFRCVHCILHQLRVFTFLHQR